jgi:hypothetical protein
MSLRQIRTFTCCVPVFIICFCSDPLTTVHDCVIMMLESHFADSTMPGAASPNLEYQDI